MSDLTPEDEAWAQQQGASLRRLERDVPEEVGTRLLAARRQAVALAETDPRRTWWPQAAGIGAIAAGVLVLAVALNVPGDAIDALPNMDEMEMAAAQETELLEELEFVAWMVAMESADEQPNQG